MSVEIIGPSGYIADVDSAGNLKVNLEATSGPTTVVQPTGSNLHVDVDNFPATQPVSGTIAVSNLPATQPVSGSVTAVQSSGSSLHVDVDNFPATQPVSGSVGVNNFPATQAVSATSLPLPAGASTDASLTNGNQKTQVTNFPATQPVSGSVTAVQSSGSSLHVDVDNFPATQPVSGTVSVSGNVTVVQPTGASLHVDVDNFPATQPVSGTVAISNFPATQPVSAASLPLPTNAAQETGGNLATLVTNTSTIATNTANETNGAQKTQVSDPISFTGANVSAKGTQGANALAVQNLTDAGRSKVILTLTKVTSITTEALVTLTQKKGDATTTTGTSYTVTAGKTLRIQSMLLSATLTVAGITAVAIRLREGASGGGAVSVTSDIISELEVSANTATIGVSGQQAIIFPDGLELAAGQIIGVSELATTVDAAVTLVIVGYEY